MLLIVTAVSTIMMSIGFRKNIMRNASYQRVRTILYVVGYFLALVGSVSFLVDHIILSVTNSWTPTTLMTACISLIAGSLHKSEED